MTTKEEFNEQYKVKKYREATYVHIEPKGGFHWRELKDSDYDDWARELKEFFRDHRSMDINDVEVIKIDKYVCPCCEVEYSNPKDAENCLLKCKEDYFKED